MSDPASYAVGWICAILTEYVAAQELLDEEHERPHTVAPNDPNDYTVGKIGEHNVVIAVLPDGEYGIASAATVAANMLNSFPNVRIGLMVGIGGGVPSPRHDIRLGDVVVSAPRNGKGGVLQYDFGKTIEGEKFQQTLFLNHPPTALRTALTGIQAQYRRKGHRIAETVNRLLNGNTMLHRDYERPPPDSDWLFKTGSIHDPRGCAEGCVKDAFSVIPRPERTELDENPAVHYGLIASANQLMKDSRVRDRLAAEEDVLCFEMEAAGLVNTFPCLVIRGICDYADSHKNKAWQGYAAMVAAIYTKDLILRIQPSRVEAEKRICDVLSDLQGVAEMHLSVSQKNLEVNQHMAKQMSTSEHQKCHQIFRLTSGTKDTTYEWYKDRVETRVEGTCEWFLNHDHFQKWLKQDVGPLLVSADPGCGNSVLAKYLIDDGLPRSATICYFFFKASDQDTVRQALCALLHQLFSLNTALVIHAIEDYRRDGRGLVNSTTSLWTILKKAVQDPLAGAIIIVLDALDECAESEMEELIRGIESQFSGHNAGRGKLKYLLTSRPYEQIVCQFTDLLELFPYVRIPVEDESECISQEVNLVIQYRVEKLAKAKRLKDTVKRHLATRLLEIPHRTYLWVYLVFDYLTTEHFKKTTKGIDSTIANLPTTINEAYERILNKSKQDTMVRKALSVMLAASQPLTVSEMNAALNVDNESTSIEDLDLEDDEDFILRLRNWCGLFISIHRGEIYFLHQTAREFLLARQPSATVTSGSHWQHSINSQDGHTALAKACVFYLDLLNNDTTPTDLSRDYSQYLKMRTFLEYSAEYWSAHYRAAGISVDDDVVSYALGICSPDSRSRAVWFRTHARGRYYHCPYGNFTSLILLSYLGLQAPTALLLERGASMEAKDSNDRTSLSLAAANGHGNIVKLLLEKGADFETKDYAGRTPLSLAAECGHEGIVKILLDKGAGFESEDMHGETPVALAAGNGHESIIKLLLETGADFETKNHSGQTLLLLAARSRDESAIKLLLEKDVDLEAKDQGGRTALSWAAGGGLESISKSLLEKGADIESHDQGGSTALLWAASNGHKSIVKILLDKAADTGSESQVLYAALSLAGESRNESIIEILLDAGADIELRNQNGETLLYKAVAHVHENTVNILLDKGAKLESQDCNGQTPLSQAAGDGREGIVKLLLDKGADVESQDCNGQTPLSQAAVYGHENTINILLDRGAKLESQDCNGQTPLCKAALYGREGIVKLLLDKGAKFESQDCNGQTPLSRAAEYGREGIVTLLLDKGADVESKDLNGQTPLSLAVQNGYEAIVSLLCGEDDGSPMGTASHRVESVGYEEG